MDVNNEFGEIRGLYWCPSKGQSAYTSEFHKIRDHLALYGHKQPEVCYTDNVADAPMLTSIFPSLLEGVRTVDPWSHLPLLVLPGDGSMQIEVIPHDKIDSTLMAFFYNSNSSVPCDDDLQPMTVALDMEWNSETTQMGPIQTTTSGNVAIITIATHSSAYVLQVSHWVNSGRLPPFLNAFLSSPKIIKVGRNIQSDLTRLAGQLTPRPKFIGACDIANLARDHGLIPNLKISLAELSAQILHHRLDKNPAIRTSNAWEDRNLADTQVEYAVLDVVAAYRIWEKLLAVPIPGTVADDSPAGTPISIWTSNRTQIAAYGVLSEPHIEVDGIRLRDHPASVVVTIMEILVPGSKLPAHRRSLSQFPTLPFAAICPWKLLQPRDLDREAHFTAPQVPSHTLLREMTGEDARNYARDEAFAETARSQVGVAQITSEGDENLPDLPVTIDSSTVHLTPEELSHLEVDRESLRHGTAMLESVPGPRPTPDSVIYSRVLKDFFHLMHGFPLGMHHGLRWPFLTAFRDAALIPDGDDVARIESYAKKWNTSFEELVRTKPAWVFMRCRRHIPPPDQLYPTLEKLFQTFGPLKDVSTGAPLFNRAAWKIAQSTLKLVKDGLVSDIPGVSLYTQIGVDSKADNLPIYKCCRGTNYSEANHRGIKEVFPTVGVGMELSNNFLRQWVFKHNLKVSMLDI
jgi:hypothetical protein